MNGKSERMNQVAICPDCKHIVGVIAITGRNRAEVGKELRNWGRKGYAIKYATNSYVRNHRWGCDCEPMQLELDEEAS